MSAHEGAECRPEEDITTHWVKTVQPFFDEVVLGNKTAECRFNDRDYKVGDWLGQKEWTGDGFTGRCIVQKITHILTHSDGPWLRPGYVMLSLDQSSPHDATELAQVTSWYNTIAPKYDALREEYKKSQNRITELETTLETVGRLLAGQKGAVAASLAAIVSAALQRARKEG